MGALLAPSVVIPVAVVVFTVVMLVLAWGIR